MTRHARFGSSRYGSPRAGLSDSVGLTRPSSASWIWPGSFIRVGFNGSKFNTRRFWIRIAKFVSWIRSGSFIRVRFNGSKFNPRFWIRITKFAASMETQTKNLTYGINPAKKSATGQPELFIHVRTAIKPATTYLGRINPCR